MTGFCRRRISSAATQTVHQGGRLAGDRNARRFRRFRGRDRLFSRVFGTCFESVRRLSGRSHEVFHLPNGLLKADHDGAGDDAVPDVEFPDVWDCGRSERRCDRSGPCPMCRTRPDRVALLARLHQLQIFLFLLGAFAASAYRPVCSSTAATPKSAAATICSSEGR